MRVDHLEQSIHRLAWSTSDANPLWEKEDLDEHAMLALLRASTFRAMGKRTEAKTILTDEVMNHDWKEFTGPLKDNWTAPCARYEMAVINWLDYVENNDNKDALKECSEWLEKVAKWESFELDARIGIRVATGRDTVGKCSVGS